jgi:hypothetical protein
MVRREREGLRGVRGDKRVIGEFKGRGERV